jgi:hypothetical protein
MCCENFFQTPLVAILDEAQRRELSAPSVPGNTGLQDGARTSNTGATVSPVSPLRVMTDDKPIWETAQS